MPPLPGGAVPPFPGGPVDPTFADASIGIGSSAAPQSFWDRVTSWASENKTLVYTLTGVVVVVTAGGISLYLADSKARNETAERKASKKDRRKAKKEAESKAKASEPLLQEEKPAVVEKEKEKVAEVLPEVDEQLVEQLSATQRTDYAARFKTAGNEAYKKKDYADAIELYSKAIICNGKDPIFFSNRAACYNAQGEWQKVVEDTTHALNLDAQYVKALNRRANAYENLDMNSEALLDYTASCIIDNFRNDAATQSVERLLKKVAEAKAKKILEAKGRKLPSAMFITNYLQSFRKKPAPEGLEETAALDPTSGLYHLQQGLVGLGQRNAEGYAKAADAFDTALEVGNLGEHEALAYNYRGTFRFLRGENNEAIEDLSKSIELQPSLIQSYIKRASMRLEGADQSGASSDFEKAVEQSKEDPDIYYHRAQLHFILGEFGEAAKDYQKSIDLDRDFIFSHVQLGVTQYKMGSIASSMATFRRCVKNFDRVPDVYNYYGELLLDQQKFDEAVQKFDLAIDLEKKVNSNGMNVLPIINKALALFQWKQDFSKAEELCQEALKIDNECDIAVATMAQLLLQQGKVTDALEYFERAAELARTEGEIANALSYAEATRTQLEVQQKYPQLAAKLAAAGAMGGAPGMQVPGMMG